MGVDIPEVRALEVQMRRAQLDADVVTIDRLVAEELLFAGPSGQLATKAHKTSRATAPAQCGSACTCPRSCVCGVPVRMS